METDNNTVGRVRNATENDITDIAEIEKRCFTEPWSENSFRLCLNENADLFVLETEDGICGFAVFDRTLGNEAELHNIAVEPSMRRRGFARKLMDAMIASAKNHGVERIMLEVRASNEGAIALYESYGFEKVGLRPGYYHHPTENAILMDLILEVEKNADNGDDL